MKFNLEYIISDHVGGLGLKNLIICVGVRPVALCLKVLGFKSQPPK
jgi:hypothetical protein